MRLWSMPVAAGLQLDAWTAFQFLLDGLKVPADKVCIVGHSMGGAVAAQLFWHPRVHSVHLCFERLHVSLNSCASFCVTSSSSRTLSRGISESSASSAGSDAYALVSDEEEADMGNGKGAGH